MRGLPLISPPPRVQLVNAFARPFDNAVATARTCYSKSGIITPAQVAGDALDDPAARDKRARARDALARSIYEAGHHTTLQHAHFQFTLENVSRQFIWTFLHSHPFYNSEQVSQRYVEVKPGQAVIPGLDAPQRALWEETLAAQSEAYHTLNELLFAPAAALYYGRFSGRLSKRAKYDEDVKKRTQEVARYVLPLATFAYLYHTVSGITLLRYHRLLEQFDAPSETRLVVRAMVDAVLAHDPLWAVVLDEPIPLESTPEHAHFMAFAGARAAGSAARFRAHFDAALEGRTSRLIDWKPNAEAVVAEGVREVLGLPPELLSDDDAIDAVMDPAQFPLHGEALALGEHSKLARVLHHPHFSFRKKLSHTADSQDQRHRMTPASRPLMLAQLDFEPDVIVPALLHHDAASLALFNRTIERSFDAARRLHAAGVDAEWCAYLLPNATAIRFTESGDLLAMHHKLAMRLCYNAQEEIWQASYDEMMQIREVHPRLGAHLGAPCTLRHRAKAKPVCPEGVRYCGVPVWKLPVEAWERVL